MLALGVIGTKWSPGISLGRGFGRLFPAAEALLLSRLRSYDPNVRLP